MENQACVSITRPPAITACVNGYTVRLCFSEQDNEEALVNSKQMLTASYSHNLLSKKYSAAPYRQDARNNT